MAISASGLFGLTVEKAFKKTIAGDIESTSVYVMLVTDSYTPAFDTHDFVADVTNEVGTGSGYTAGGKALAATPALVVGSPAAGQMNYDSADPAWATSTITSAMAGVGYYTTGSTATDQLLWLSDFVTAASTTNGTFTIQVHADGWWYIDFTP